MPQNWLKKTKLSVVASLLVCATAYCSAAWSSVCVTDSSGNITSNCDDFTWSSGSVSNSYVISSVAQAPLLVINATPNTFTNTSSGSILGGTGLGIFVYFNSVVTAINNDGLVSSVNDHGLFNYYYSTIDQLNNSGSIVSTNRQGVYNYDHGAINLLSNSGTITGGIVNFVGSSIAQLNNTSRAFITSGDTAIVNIGTSIIGAINNAGTISGTSVGIFNELGSSISAITNTGIISGAGSGINNLGTITRLSNSQSGLTYAGVLPSSYGIILGATPASYGTLNYLTGGGALSSFQIDSGSVKSSKYAGVLSGITSVAGQTAGMYSGFSYRLVLEPGSLNIWDLFFGPSTADTQQSLVNTASVLQNIYTLQNSVLANSFSFDCALFDKNNVCISAGGRNTAVSAANGLNNTSGLLIAAYRPHKHYRVGAYVDQNLSVNNAGSTVNLGNNTPLIGLFGAWNERLDGAGTEVKVSAAYGQKNTTVTRAVVGTSEAGTGGSQLNSQGAQVTAKYGFGVTENVIISPYAGIRYTQNNMGGYTESTSSAVTAPLTYSALNTNATTALAGVGGSYRFIPKATVYASAGVETDTNTANGSYSATGVIDLTSVNFNPNPVKTRPTAMVGATYDFERNHRLGLTGIYRQEPYQAVSSTTVMATYTVGL
jgi:hypothetical protein